MEGTEKIHVKLLYSMKQKINAIIFFSVCERAEFSKSCKLIGSGSVQFFYDLAR